METILSFHLRADTLCFARFLSQLLQPRKHTFPHYLALATLDCARHANLHPARVAKPRAGSRRDGIRKVQRCCQICLPRKLLRVQNLHVCLLPVIMNLGCAEPDRGLELRDSVLFFLCSRVSFSPSIKNYFYSTLRVIQGKKALVFEAS